MTPGTMLVDSHCHLVYPGLAEREDAVIRDARARGVGHFLTIATQRGDWDATLAVARRHDCVSASVGVHPHHADAHRDVDAADLVARAEDPAIVAFGECGLDYHYKRSSPEAQAAGFRQHIAAARATGLPVIVHSRDADDDTMDIIEDEQGRGGFTGVIHCFTGGATFARRAVAAGFHISLSGIVTFRNAVDLQAVARDIPGDRLLVETDAPFLAPVPHRGRTAEPGMVADTAAFLARLRGVEAAALAAETTNNFFRLFSRARRCG